MKTLRIFISSPGDVAEERDRAKQVVESLRRRYAGKFVLKPLLWEELPLQPDMSFQQGIDMVLSQDRGLEVAVFILWSRLGTPLGKTIPRPDGSEYRSGTEREFDLIMQARKQSGGQRPHVLVYTRRDETSFDERLRGKTTDEKKGLLEQKELVEGFIKEEFHDSETGLNRSAYHSFDRPVTFAQRLRTHLQEVLDELAGGSAEVIWDTEKQGPPFMGLEAFQPQHADVFFGREEEILEARHALREQARNGCAFLLLSGASGSGKSSLARAGILPAICDLELDEQVASWRTIIVTPADLAPDPFAALVTRLADALPVARASSPQQAQNPYLGQDARATNLSDLAADLRENPGITLRQAILPAFARASSTSKGPIRLLLLIDQLEEFFASTAINAEDRTAFFAAIEALARSGSVWVLATLRSDFYQQVQSEPALVRLKSGHGQLDILAPGPDALRRLIEEPARLAGLSFETCDGQSLADRILRDAAAHAELLPLVEFVLRELYEQRTANGQLTFAAYDSLRGVEGALASRAEHAFRSLPGDSQETLATVLQSLVTIGNDTDSAATDAQEERLVRQRAPLSAFADSPAARRFVDTFIAERLFTSSGEIENTQSSLLLNPKSSLPASVTIAHESLLRVWPRALQWSDQNRDFLRTRARIAARIKEGSPLLEGDPLLEQAGHWIEVQTRGFDKPQQVWIQDAMERAYAGRRRAQQRRRKVIAILGVLAATSAAGMVVALLKWQEASKERDAAETARQAEVAAAHESGRARQTAESLINSLLFDMRDRMRAVGRLDLLQDLSSSAQRYFESLPPGQRTVHSEYQRAAALALRGDILASIGQRPGGIRIHLEALAIRISEQSRASDDVSWREAVADSLGRIAELYLQDGDTAQAESFAVRFHEWCRDRLTDRNGTSHRLRQASSLGALSTVRELQQKIEEAEPLAAECQALLAKLASEFPADVSVQRELALSLSRRGRIGELAGRLDDAERFYLQAKDAFAALAEADPGNARYQRDLAVAWEESGLIQEKRGAFVEAEGSYRRYHGIATRLLQQDPANAKWARDVSVASSHLADIALARHQPEAAVSALHAAWEIDRGLAGHPGAGIEARRDAAITSGRLGELLLPSSREEALQLLKESRATFQRLAEGGAEESRLDFARAALALGRAMLQEESARADAKVCLEEGLAALGELTVEDAVSLRSALRTALLPP